MKTCPSCGATAGDPCPRCGKRGGTLRPTVPNAPGAKIGAFTVVRAHGEGDLWVTDETGVLRLLVFGAPERILAEAEALDSGSLGLPRVLARGEAPEVGPFLLLAAETQDAVPLLHAQLSLTDGFALVRRLLEVAAGFEARGLSWEPFPTDLYLAKGRELVVLRARGARKLLVREPLDAKKVLEVLAGTLLPEPFGETTPSLVRLLLPRFNFSTPVTRSIAGAQEELRRAEAAALQRVGGSVAELCDPGLRRAHNEDATASATERVLGQSFTVLVVCDGVSSSTHAGEASALAATITRDALSEFARTRASDATPESINVSSAVVDAVRAAHRAVCAAPIAFGDGTPPGTTIVAAVVFRGELTVAWVGDSRAYLVSDLGSELCTRDHSWLNDAVARGAVTLGEAMASPLAHALTRCLGPLERGASEGFAVEVKRYKLYGPGWIVLCTDGLWNYFPSSESIAALVRAAGPSPDAEAVARLLVCRALAEGGGDNVSVVVHQLSAP